MSKKGKGRREFIRLKQDESAMIIRNTGLIELVGESHSHILGPLAGVLLADNKELAEAIQENYKQLIAKSGQENKLEQPVVTEGVKNEATGKND